MKKLLPLLFFPAFLGAIAASLVAAHSQRIIQNQIPTTQSERFQHWKYAHEIYFCVEKNRYEVWCGSINCGHFKTLKKAEISRTNFAIEMVEYENRRSQKPIEQPCGVKIE